MLYQIFIIFFSFLAIWFAARLIMATVSSLAHLLRLSAFAVSFFVLGLATSLPEFFVSAGALEKRPEIAAGTLFGASIVIFLFVIPLLSIAGDGIGTNHQLKPKTLVFSLLVIFLPFAAALDNRLDRQDAVIMIAAYFLLFYLVEKRRGFIAEIERGFGARGKAELWDLIKIIFGAVILFFAGRELVAQTIQLGQTFSVSPFIISLLILSLGADIPETAIAVASVFKKTKSIAMGDYLGSAAANTLIFGVLTLISGEIAFSDRNFIFTFCIFLLGLLLFFLFARTKRNLSRAEGLVLLAVYALFLAVKIFNP